VDGRRPNLWFIASWALLVLVVAYGFYLHQRFIERLDDRQQEIVVLLAERQQGLIELCGVMLDQFPEPVDDRIVHAFDLIGVECGSADQVP
jgi:hypothetical protein